MLSDLIDGGHSIVQLGIDCFLLGFGLQKEEAGFSGIIKNNILPLIFIILLFVMLVFGTIHVSN